MFFYLVLFVLCCLYFLCHSTAVPSIMDKVVMHKIIISYSESTVSTELHCNMEKGRLAQRYSIKWLQETPAGDSIVTLESKLTLNVNFSFNGSEYKCQITIDHDGKAYTTYNETAILITEHHPPLAVVLLYLAAYLMIILTPPVFIAMAVEQLLNDKKMDITFTIASLTLTVTTQKQQQHHIFFDRKALFKLLIPHGAVLGYGKIYISADVTLFGPYKFPKGFRPVSPVFWFCVGNEENFQFSKPVSISIPHFLDINNDDDILSLGLTFLKADHKKNSEGQYEFQPADGQMDIRAFKRYGILRSTDFCLLCIGSENELEALNLTQFCIFAVVPQNLIAVGKSVKAFFFVTFNNLNACLMKVEKVIKTMNLGEDYQIEKKLFWFENNTEDPALEMVITQPKHGEIGVIGKTKVDRKLF